MTFLTRSHRLAALCGAVPLSLGTGIFIIWLVARWDWLMFAGAIVLYGGVAVGSMPAGTVARRSFWIRHDGELVFRASRGADTIEQVIDPYVTNNGGGHTTVTVQQDVKIVVAHLAVHELAWADRIRDELFWLNHAACALWPDRRRAA